jgi:thiamine-phosphate pyrophosphorylase
MLPFKLLLITDWSRPGCPEIVAEALKAGPGIAVQHRHHGVSDRQFYEEALRLKDVCGSAPLFINGRLDVALALEAHLHLGGRSLLPGDARPLMGRRWVSLAIHLSPHPDPLPARGEGDVYLVSPVFDPLSKSPERPAIGVEAFQNFANTTPTPCFALGGITAARAALLRPVAGVAVIGEVMHAASPAHAAEALLRALE